MARRRNPPAFAAQALDESRGLRTIFVSVGNETPARLGTTRHQRRHHGSSPAVTAAWPSAPTVPGRGRCRFQDVVFTDVAKVHVAGFFDGDRVGGPVQPLVS